ncbi:hypothetical protein [Streptomyces sp. NPDC051211]|uniref:hypothetical protein n=1 Tax=Streptomyces sp. NPDC051211 TaxID=3154643 RepID=UPI0034504AE1
MKRVTVAAAAVGLMLFGAAAPARAGLPPATSDLALGGYSIPTKIKAGQKQKIRFGFTHAGQQPVERVRLYLYTQPGLSYEQRFSNCEYATHQVHRSRLVACTLTGPFLPGASYRLPEGMELTAKADFWKAVHSVEVFPDGPDERKRWPGFSLQPGKGPELKIAATDRFEEDRSFAETVSLTNPAGRPDLGVTGASATGKAGGEVRLSARWHNRGPGSIHTFNPAYRVASTEFLLGEGFTYVKGDCDPVTRKGVTRWNCPPAGQHLTPGSGPVNAVFKIASWVRPGVYEGEFRFDPEGRPFVSWQEPGTYPLHLWDITPANNSAKITITVTADDGQNPGPGPTPSPSPTTSTAPTTAPTGSPTPTTTPTATVTGTPTGTPGPTPTTVPAPAPTATGPDGGVDTRGSLARTGSTALTAGGIAAAAIVLGAALWALARKRRNS